MHMAHDKSKHEDYLAFYQRVYGDFLVERRLVDGKDSIGMFIAQQPEGYFPDEATSTYNLQLNLGNEVLAGVDLGAGKHEVRMKRGGFVIAPPETRTEYNVFNKHRLMCLGVPSSFFDNAASDLGIDINSIEAMLTDTHLDPVVRQVVKECWAESNNNTARGALFVDANLMTLASRILTLAIGKEATPDAAKESPLSDALYERVCQYVDSNIDTSLRMKSLARLVDMNEYGFSRAFKARTGHSPYQWVIERRLTRAELLLRQSKMELAEIAFAVGFSSQSHMTTLFSQRLGVTPAEFRKSLRSAN
jgi:AraC family transcriptional regulator